MQRVIAHVHDHLDAQLDLNALADIACLSPHHWHRVYHAMYGETLAHTVKRLRLHRARVSSPVPRWPSRVWRPRPATRACSRSPAPSSRFTASPPRAFGPQGSTVTSNFPTWRGAPRPSYRWLFGAWLPNSGFEPSSGPVVEEYLNSPRETAPRDLRTLIHLPLRTGGIDA